jgi:hypothetical protein
MLNISWIQAVKVAWASYINKMNKYIESESMESYLSQKIDMGMTLQEFAEMVFIEGFTAGEKHANKSILRGDEYEHQLN